MPRPYASGESVYGEGEMLMNREIAPLAYGEPFDCAQGRLREFG